MVSAPRARTVDSSAVGGRNSSGLSSAPIMPVDLQQWSCDQCAGFAAHYRCCGTCGRAAARLEGFAAGTVLICDGRLAREATASQGTIAPEPPAQNLELCTLTSDRASPTGQARNRPHDRPRSPALSVSSLVPGSRTDPPIWRCYWLVGVVVHATPNRAICVSRFAAVDVIRHLVADCLCWRRSR